MIPYQRKLVYRLAIVCSIFLLVFSACRRDLNKVVIDNPTSKEIWVEIGIDRYDLQPYSSVELLLENGSYKLYSGEVESGKSISSGDSIHIFSEGIINASLSEYVVWRTIYLKSPSHSHWMEQRLKDTSVVMGGFAYKADMRVFNENDIFIPIQWDLWLDQQIPLTWNGMGPGKRISKIYRMSQFEQTFQRFVR